MFNAIVTQKIITRNFYTARYTDWGFFGIVHEVKHSVPVSIVESELKPMDFQFSPTCRWIDESPIGRVIEGEGFKATLRYTKTGYEAIMVQASVAPEPVLAELAWQNIPVARDFQFVALPMVVNGNAGDKLAHQRKFYGLLSSHKDKFISVELDDKQILTFYRSFGTDADGKLPAKTWARAAAEIECMVNSEAILKQRAAEMRRNLSEKGACAE